MLDRTRNQIAPGGSNSPWTHRLTRVATAISHRVDALDDRVRELESAAGPGVKAATNRAQRRGAAGGGLRGVSGGGLRNTDRGNAAFTSEFGSTSVVVLGKRLKADGQHCQDLVRRTKNVLRFCLTAFWTAPRTLVKTDTDNA
jgi:hypothetical protein